MPTIHTESPDPQRDPQNRKEKTAAPQTEVSLTGLQELQRLFSGRAPQDSRAMVGEFVRQAQREDSEALPKINAMLRSISDRNGIARVAEIFGDLCESGYDFSLAGCLPGLVAITCHHISTLKGEKDEAFNNLVKALRHATEAFETDQVALDLFRSAADEACKLQLVQVLATTKFLASVYWEMTVLNSYLKPDVATVDVLTTWFDDLLEHSTTKVRLSVSTNLPRAFSITAKENWNALFEFGSRMYEERCLGERRANDEVVPQCIARALCSHLAANLDVFLPALRSDDRSTRRFALAVASSTRSIDGKSQDVPAKVVATIRELLAEIGPLHFDCAPTSEQVVKMAELTNAVAALSEAESDLKLVFEFLYMCVSCGKIGAANYVAKSLPDLADRIDKKARNSIVGPLRDVPLPEKNELDDYLVDG